MRSKIDYYILIPKEERERFHKNLNKTVAAVSMSVGELGNAFGRVAKILRKANKYIAENDKNIPE
jgi:hypothetical protein